MGSVVVAWSWLCWGVVYRGPYGRIQPSVSISVTVTIDLGHRQPNLDTPMIEQNKNGEDYFLFFVESENVRLVYYFHKCVYCSSKDTRIHTRTSVRFSFSHSIVMFRNVRFSPQLPSPFLSSRYVIWVPLCHDIILQGSLMFVIYMNVEAYPGEVADGVSPLSHPGLLLYPVFPRYIRGCNTRQPLWWLLTLLVISRNLIWCGLELKGSSRTKSGRGT